MSSPGSAWGRAGHGQVEDAFLVEVMVTTWGWSTFSVSSSVAVGAWCRRGVPAVTSAVLLTSPASMSAWVMVYGGGALDGLAGSEGREAAAVSVHGRVGDGDVAEGDVAGVGDVEAVVDRRRRRRPGVAGHVSVEVAVLVEVDSDDWGMVDVFGVVGRVGRLGRGVRRVTSAVLLTSPASMSAWVMV